MRLPLLAGLFCALAAPAASAATVLAEAATRVLECAGGDAAIEGSHNTITFTGACRSLSVRGDLNTVTIELAPGAVFDIQGNANRVRYSFTPPPLLRVSGRGTDIAPLGDPSANSMPVALTGDGAALDLDCAGRDVVIHGNKSAYTLRGGCRSLAASGDGNTIRAELRPDASAVISGNDTALAYTVLGAGDPPVSVRGLGSHAERAAGKPAAFAGSTVPMPPASGAAAADPVPLPDPLALATPLPGNTAAAPASPPSVSAPRLSVLVHALGARVVAGGTQVSTSADDLFLPGSDTLRHGAEPRLRELVQLSGMVQPSAVRVVASDPSDSELAGRRAHALQAWLTANGVGVKEAAAGNGSSAAVDILLAR